MDPSTFELPSTVAQTLSACPRFRILLVGNSGVGKSSLVSKIFNVDPKDIDIADGRPGEADIDREYTSDNNQRFVLHDSRGFEAGSSDNWATIEKFLCERNAKELSERVHIIWLCIESPRQGSRLLQKGDENLIELANDLVIPVVTVCTKYDMLLDEQGFLHSKKNPDKPINTAELERNAEACFNDRVQGLMRPGSVIVKVSTDRQYSRSPEFLNNLTVVTSRCLGATDLPPPEPNIETTSSGSNEIGQALAGENGGRETSAPTLPNESVLVAWDAAQQMNPRQKVDASIREGLKGYWSQVMRRAFFKGQTMNQFVRRIHEDIIMLWNFYDPNKLLIKEEFFEQILQLVSPILEDHKAEIGKGMEELVTKAFSALPSVGAAVPHAVPFLAVAVVGAWTIKYLLGVYQEGSLSSQYLSAYIIGLTCVLHGLFTKTLQLEPPRTISKELIADAIKDYKDYSAQRVIDATRMWPLKIEGKIRDLIYANIDLAAPESSQPFVDDSQQVIGDSIGAEAAVALASDHADHGENAPTVDKPSGKSPELAGGTSDGGAARTKRRKRKDRDDEHDSSKCVIA